MMTSALKPVVVLWLALLASLGSLAAAYTAQYHYHLTPCHLCLAQRVPFAAVLIIAPLGLAQPKSRRWLILVISAVFLVNSGIAAYHTGVEQHWVPGPTGCTQEPAPQGQSAEEFLARIQKAPIVSCDQPQWEFHGITMAAMNMVWCLLLAVFTFLARPKYSRKEAAHA